MNIVRMVEKNIKEEEEPGVEERRAREQLGEGVEVRLESFQKICLSEGRFLSLPCHFL